MNVACANSYIVYNMIHPNDLTLLDFKTILPTYLIGRYRQVETEQHQMAKHVPKECIGISLSKVTYHHIFQSLKIFVDDVNFATKRELT